MNFEQEIPKYRKKTESNTSKSKSKTNHKHEYKECLFVNNKRPYFGSYCKICGKVLNWISPCVKVDGFMRMMTPEEIYKEYGELEKIEVQDLWSKYIPI